jgi:histidinol-phosphatase (PHP family)
MQLNVDIHVHTNHSVDSKAPLNEMCRAAVQKGFKYICFTDHYDLNPHDDGYNFYHYEKYARDLDQAREQYASELTVLKGIEFGEPHRYPQHFETILKNGYDFVLGSVHWLGKNWVGEKVFQEKHGIQEIYEIHYNEVFKAVQFGGFDSLAHIDFPKRYLPGQYEPGAELDAIMKELVKQNISLELNSSPVRRGLAEICPSKTILERYIQNGGSKVTIGSDAHSADHIGADFDRVKEYIDIYGLKNLIYINREETIINGKDTL